MNETGGWSNLGDRDLATGAPASAQVQGATPSFPDGNNVAGTREGPELLQPQDTIGGTPVGNDTGVMGTGAGPVGTSMGPGVLGNNQGDMTVNATSPMSQGNAPDMQDTSADVMPNATPPRSDTSMSQNMGQGTSVDASQTQSGMAGSVTVGSADTMSDVTVNGTPLPVGQDTVLGSGGLIGSRDTGANANSGVVGPETGDTAQTDSGLVGIGDQGAADTQQARSGFEGTDSQGTGDTAQADTGLLGWADQGAANTQQAQGGLEGSATGNAITNSNAGTEFTGAVDPDMAGALPQPGGPLNAGPLPMGGLAQPLTPGDMGDAGTRPIVDEVPPSGANPDLVEAANNGTPANDVGTVGAAPSGIVGGYADTGTGQAGGAQPSQDTLADQLRADQPVGDVISPEENTNQPPA